MQKLTWANHYSDNVISEAGVEWGVDVTFMILFRACRHAH